MFNARKTILRWAAIFLVLVTVLVLAEPVLSQCAMCKQNAEQAHLEHDFNFTRGINSSIFFLLFMMYGSAAVVITMIVRMGRRADAWHQLPNDPQND